MARFGFVGPSYQSQSVNADCQVCMNLYPEILESGDAKSRMALYPTPGLISFFAPPDADTGPSRGEYVINGRLFHVSGGNVYEVGIAGTALKTYAAAIVNDAKPVSFAGGPNQLLIASGGNAYVIDLTLNTLTLIPAGTLTNVSMVAYIDGFFFALIKNSNQIFASTLLDATSWPGLSTTKVSVFTDNVIAIYADHRELAVLGPRASQVYYDSGNFPFPLDIIPGAYIEQGIVAQFSVVKIDNSVFWLGADERGAGMCWLAQGYKPVRISNHAMEFAWQGYARIDDAIAYAYQDQGHSFYVLSFPTAQKTWVYDVATNMWHERGFWNTQAGSFDAHRGQYHAFAFGKHLVSGPKNGVIYQMSIGIFNDFGNSIRRVRRAPHISSEQEWIFHSQLQVDAEVGTGSFTLPGLVLADGNGILWKIEVDDSGVLHGTKTAVGNTQRLFLNDPTNAASWQIKVTTAGILTATSVTLDVTYPKTFNLLSQTGNSNWSIVVTLLGLVQTTPILSSLVAVTPAGTPQFMLRWSDDGGHTWSNLYNASMGGPGQYKVRAIWRRLGRSRDRVYELSFSDNAACRIVDAYLQASPGYQPTERLTTQMRKSA